MCMSFKARFTDIQPRLVLGLYSCPYKTNESEVRQKCHCSLKTSTIITKIVCIFRLHWAIFYPKYQSYVCQLLWMRETEVLEVKSETRSHSFHHLWDAHPEVQPLQSIVKLRLHSVPFCKSTCVASSEQQQKLSRKNKLLLVS